MEECGTILRTRQFPQATEATERLGAGEGIQIAPVSCCNFALTSEAAIMAVTVMQGGTLSVIWHPYGVGKRRALNFR